MTRTMNMTFDDADFKKIEKKKTEIISLIGRYMSWEQFLLYMVDRTNLIKNKNKK